jgi:hypothetical protein
VKRAHLIERDSTQTGKSFSLRIGYFGGRFLQESVFPIFLLNKVFAQFFTAGTPVFDVDKAGTNLTHIVALLHHIPADNSLTAVTFQTRLHSV